MYKYIYICVYVVCIYTVWGFVQSTFYSKSVFYNTASLTVELHVEITFSAKPWWSEVACLRLDVFQTNCDCNRLSYKFRTTHNPRSILEMEIAMFFFPLCWLGCNSINGSLWKYQSTTHCSCKNGLIFKNKKHGFYKGACFCLLGLTQCVI